MAETNKTDTIQGRKKHKVEGTVTPIKKGRTGLGTGKVGESGGLIDLISSLFTGRKK